MIGSMAAAVEVCAHDVHLCCKSKFPTAGHPEECPGEVDWTLRLPSSL